MSVTRRSNSQGCHACSNEDIVTDSPISGSVGLGGVNRRDDVLRVQQYLNALAPTQGGPTLVLAEDGLIGPRTQAAINRFQSTQLGFQDGRVDVSGKTIKALTTFICNSPTVPFGKIGQPESGVPAANTANPGPSPTGAAGADLIAVAHISLRVMEPRLQTLRFRLTRATPPMIKLLDKHFAHKKATVTNTDIGHVNKILGAVHFQMARFNAFGKLPFENVILFDPAPPDSTIAYTVRGGDKLSTNQFQIYRDKGKDKKFPGNSIWLTSIFADQPSHEKHWTVLHEFCHFVGARDGLAGKIDDHAYAFENKFVDLSKFQKLHNAESLSLFFLEFCFGTRAISILPRLKGFTSHFDAFPKVTPAGDIVTS